MVKQNVRLGNNAAYSNLNSGSVGAPTINYGGGLSFKMDPYTELYTRVASCFFGEPTFYKEQKNGMITAQNQDDLLLTLARQLAEIDPEFVLKLAAYARNELNLRTISVVLWVEVAMLAKKTGAGGLVRRYTPSILKRADEPGEAIAYFIGRNSSFIGDGGRNVLLAKKGVTLPHSMQKGIEDAIFTNYGRYNISKYDSPNAAVKQKDVINLVHPRPSRMKEGYPADSWSRLFNDVVTGNLKPAETWEDTLMNYRQKGFESKKAAWESIIPKMPYMATLRNLKNFIEEGIEEKYVLEVENRLKDPEQVRKSKQFPYRFYTAYLMLDSMQLTHNNKTRQRFQGALEDAITIAVEHNLKDIRWSGKTAITSDWSQSMDAKLSEKSIISRKAVGGLMMCMANKLTEDNICMLFADQLAMVNIRERDGILSNLDRMLQVNIGGRTNAWLTVQYLIHEKISVDRFVIFSDLQCYDSTSYTESKQFVDIWKEYKSKVNPNAYLYSFNLASYGNSLVPQNNDRICLLGGFSEKVLQFVPMYESIDKTNGIDKIKNNVTSSTYSQELRRNKGADPMVGIDEATTTASAGTDAGDADSTVSET